ncbi:MAG: hypothetical protein SFU83_22160 [Meiothermus sp.]|nr:hypothetical protein [Meiothermus sp.]
MEKRLLVDGYPLLVLRKDEKKIVVSEGYYKNIIEFLLNASKPSEPWAEERGGVKLESIDHLLHQGFVSGEGWALSEVFYGHLIQLEEFAEYQQDPEFLEELERYQKRFGQPPNEPVWNVRVSSGSWRNSAQYIPQSSVHKIIKAEATLLLGKTLLPEGVSLVQELPPSPFALLVDGYTVWVRLDENDLPQLSARESIARAYGSEYSDRPILEFLLEQAQNDATFPEFWRRIQLGAEYKSQTHELFQVAPSFDDFDYPHVDALFELQRRLGRVPEPIWVYSDRRDPRLRFHCLAHSTLHKVVWLARELVLCQYILLLEGLEVLSENAWDLRFGWAGSTGMLPGEIRMLEEYAASYLRALENNASNLERERSELLELMTRGRLFNRDLDVDGVLSQIEEAGATHLLECATAALGMFRHLDHHARRYPELDLPTLDDVGKLPVALDWFLRPIDFPADRIADFGEFTAHAETAWHDADPQSLVPLEMEFLGIPVHLLLAWDGGVPKLAHAERILSKSPTEADDIEAYHARHGLGAWDRIPYKRKRGQP